VLTTTDFFYKPALEYIECLTSLIQIYFINTNFTYLNIDFIYTDTYVNTNFTYADTYVNTNFTYADTYVNTNFTYANTYVNTNFTYINNYINTNLLISIQISLQSFLYQYTY
jgi:hypothetical protein